MVRAAAFGGPEGKCVKARWAGVNQGSVEAPEILSRRGSRAWVWRTNGRFVRRDAIFGGGEDVGAQQGKPGIG